LEYPTRNCFITQLAWLCWQSHSARLFITNGATNDDPAVLVNIILLACNRRHASGLGNSSGLVGRYFMDHPRLQLGKLTLREPWRRNKLYDIMFHYLNRAVRANGTHVSAQLTVSHAVQKRERMLNARVWFSSIFPGEGTAAAEALKRMKFRLHGKIDPSHGFWRDIGILAREPLNAANFIAARQLRPVGVLKELHFQMIREAHLQMICEPAPDPDSRVTLAESRDALGMPRARVDWRLGDLVKHTFDRTVAIVGKALSDAGIAEMLIRTAIGGVLFFAFLWLCWKVFVKRLWIRAGEPRGATNTVALAID